MLAAVSIPAITPRAVQVAVVLEAAWALFLAYEIHRHSSGMSGGWQLQLLNFVQEWAEAAVAIVVVTWLVDVAVAQYRNPRAS
jgi:hypothetical protein